MACEVELICSTEAICFERGCRNCASACYGLLVCYGLLDPSHEPALANDEFHRKGV